MTILEALKAKATYPLDNSFFETVLVERGLASSTLFTQEVSKSKDFQLALADCYKQAATGVNVTEGSLSINIPERNRLMALANSIYTRYGEDASGSDVQPAIKRLDW